MQEEIENRTVNLAISTTRLTANTLIAGFKKYMLSMKAISEKAFTSIFCFRSIALKRKLWKAFWICWWIPVVPSERPSVLPEMISQPKWSRAGS